MTTIREGPKPEAATRPIVFNAKPMNENDESAKPNQQWGELAIVAA
jgi:hypothetical protein